MLCAVWVGVSAYVSGPIHAWRAVWEHYTEFLSAVCGGGTSEMGMVFGALLKHLRVSRPPNHPTNDTWAVWGAQYPLAAAHEGVHCYGCAPLGLP
jgi:hypothetical protein